MAVSKDTKTGKWQSQVWYIDWQGNRKRKHKRGFDTKRAAQAWERDFVGQEHGELISMPALVKAFKMDMEQKVGLGNLKESTLHNKTNFIDRYIAPYFNQGNIADIRTKDINAWIAALNRTNKYNERMSSSTLNITRNMLSQIFEYAVKHYGLAKNPVKGSEVVKAFSNDKRSKVWSLDQYRTFYQSLTKPWHKVVFNALLWSGLRIGELMVLTPADINGTIISVNKTLVTFNHGVSKPKNLSSTREVAVPEPLAAQLQEYISSLDGIAPTDRIFEYDDSTVRSFLRNRAAQLGLPRISPHNLRHTYASIMLEQTGDIAMVSYQLGHSTPQTTLSIYSHMVPGANAAQVKKVENLIEI